MFRFFETRIDTFPPAPPKMPPRGLLPFILYYSRPLLPWFGVAAALTIALSVIELTFFSFTGELVDWLASADRATFWAEHGSRLVVMGVLVVVVFPLVVWFQSLVHNQTIFGNHSMLARWLAHRYVIDQSLSFFQNEFAGRIATKVMQTAQAVRDVLMKIVDVFVYISVFFVGTLVLVGQADPILIIPLVIWLAGYIAILVYFIPRMGEVSSAQANARAELTGRIVDSYTNIQTVKLFAHSRREQDYAKEAMVDFMGTVYPMFRLTTRLNIALETLNALLLFGIGGLAITAWINGTISPGAIAVAVALAMRLRSTAQWIIWEVSGLFEQIGVVKDGMNTIAQ
ncbi:MAG: ABC transporter transmembrane domain-containing protein, partial [Bauldia sp.]